MPPVPSAVVVHALSVNAYVVVVFTVLLSEQNITLVDWFWICPPLRASAAMTLVAVVVTVTLPRVWKVNACTIDCACAGEAKTSNSKARQIAAIHVGTLGHFKS